MGDAVYDNVALAKKAYSHLDKKASERTIDDLQAKLDLLADDVIFKVACSEDMPVYGGEIHGKIALVDFYTMRDPGVLEDLELEHAEFIGDGDRVLILGTQRYKIKKTGVTVRNKHCVIVLTFRDGKLVRIVSIEDMWDWKQACKAA